MPKESAYTSQNQVSKTFTTFELGKKNLDFGGGKYDTGTEYLNQHGTRNYVYDPFNRNKEHNDMVTNVFNKKKFDTITLCNVLNVIKSKEERRAVLRTIRLMGIGQMLDHDVHPVIIFQVYEGNKSGIPSTGKTTQNNMKTADYIEEIKSVFPQWEVQQQGNFLIV